MNSRRQILKLIGMAPAAASAAVPQLGALLASPAMAAVATAKTMGGGSNSGGALQQVSYGLLGPVIGKQVQALQRQAEDELQAIREARLGQIDPDIACLRSVSHVNKMRKQVDRNLEHSTVMRHASQALWG